MDLAGDCGCRQPEGGMRAESTNETGLFEESICLQIRPGNCHPGPRTCFVRLLSSGARSAVEWKNQKAETVAPPLLIVAELSFGSRKLCPSDCPIFGLPRVKIYFFKLPRRRLSFFA